MYESCDHLFCIRLVVSSSGVGAAAILVLAPVGLESRVPNANAKFSQNHKINPIIVI